MTKQNDTCAQRRLRLSMGVFFFVCFFLLFFCFFFFLGGGGWVSVNVDYMIGTGGATMKFT